MQLARDPHSLGVDAAAGFLLPGLLGPRRPVTLGGQPLAARRHVPADRAGGEQLRPHRGVRASKPAEWPKQTLGHEDRRRPGEPSGNRDAPRPGQRDPVHPGDDRNERGTVNLAERRPSHRAAHGQPEYSDRMAVAPDQGEGGHCQQQISGQRRMTGQVQATVVVHRVGLDVAPTTASAVTSMTPAAFSQRCGSLTMLLMPITRSVYRQWAAAIVAAQADALPRWEYPLLPMQQLTGRQHDDARLPQPRTAS